MPNPWTVFWIVLGIGALVLWAHYRECSEISHATARERNPYLAGAGMIAMLFCAFETAESAMMFAWLAPAQALQTRCEQIDNDMLVTTIHSGGFRMDQSEVDASDLCHERLRAMAGIGATILTHGEN